MPRELTPIYILIWRLILTYFTLGFGFLVFSSWVRQRAQGRGPERRWRSRPGSAMSQTHDDADAAGRGYDARAAAPPARLPPALPRADGGARSLLLLRQSALALVGPRLTEHALDVAIPQHDIGLLGLLAGALPRRRCCSSSWSSTAARCSPRYIGQRVMYDLRMQIFAHLQRLSISYFDRNPVGRLMTRVTSDVETLNELFSSGRGDRSSATCSPSSPSWG